MEPVRGLWTVLSASDPGLLRLRTAGTTLVSLVVAVGALYGLATAWGKPVTSVVLGIVVAMIASMAVNDPEPAQQAVSTALLVPPAAAAASLGAVLAGHLLAGHLVFVGVVVAAVFLRLLGPRGTAMGMIGFIAYFLALFLQVTPAQLPVQLTAAAVGALVSLVVRIVARPRDPDREVGRMLSALGVRAGAVVGTLARGMRDGGLDERRTRRLRARVGASQETAIMVERRLASAGEPVFDGLDNDALTVRVVDFQLFLEHLARVAVPIVVDAGLPGGARAELAGALSALRGTMQVDDPPAEARPEGARGAVDGHAGPDTADERVDRLHRTLQRTADSWRFLRDPRAGDAGADGDVTAGRPDEDAPEQDGGDGDTTGGGKTPGALRDTARQALQAGVAAALAIVVGQLLSPTRWFWAVIAAFVVFTGTSTRGEILSKGWQRVLGTLAGVVAGVLVAALVGGHTGVALLLIAVCLFLGVYLMPISSGIMIFFITTMLALLYGLLGRFSVGLLVLRLEETAAGAAIGVLVSFVVLPASTRRATRDKLATFLGDLADLIGQSTAALTGEAAGDPDLAAGARAFRTGFDGLRTTAKPLTDGLSGLTNRAAFQRMLVVMGACENHARALARLADVSRAVAAPAAPRAALTRGARAVCDNIAAVAGGLDAGLAGVTVRSAEDVLDLVEHAALGAEGTARIRLLAVARHLRAVDRSLCRWATDLGATAGEPVPAGAGGVTPGAGRTG